jgi:hypothetical protein
MQIRGYCKLRQKYAEENAETLKVMTGLAGTVSKRGRYSEAKDMANRALKKVRNSFIPCNIRRFLIFCKVMQTFTSKLLTMKR